MWELIYFFFLKFLFFDSHIWEVSRDKSGRSLLTITFLSILEKVIKWF